LFIPGKHGSLQIELQAATRRQGLLAYTPPPQLHALLAEVAAGRPTVVLQNLALNWYPMWHYAVVVGYDIERGEMILRSGPERRQIVSMAVFERTWKRGGSWALVALPPHQLPASQDEARYLDAAIALEQTRQLVPARAAYAAAGQRWPDSLAALMGRGNTAYALGDLVDAEAAFREATQKHPQASAAFNNLADTLLQQHKLVGALGAARRAVELDGGRREVFAQTLRDIEAAIARAATD